jgi:hypothetical protein
MCYQAQILIKIIQNVGLSSERHKGSRSRFLVLRREAAVITSGTSGRLPPVYLT